jgi:tRNA (adenine22-N1)-methyltransferase
MNLTPRLETIANLVKKGSIIADIGTDHGYIPVFLIENGICEKGIAADVNRGPLNNAKNFIKERGLQDKIETRLGDGLKVLKPNEVDTVIIAGMGGLLINKILMESKEIANTVKRFILQPMTASDEVRRFLYNNNYKIVEEKLAKEGDKIYEIICAEHGKDTVEDEIFFEVGKKLFENKDILLGEFLLKKINKLEEITNNLKNTSSEEGKKKYEEVNKKYRRFKELMNGYVS